MESLYYIISGVQPAAECKLAPESRSVVYKCDDCCCAASWQCASPPAVTCAAWRWPAVPAAPTAAAHHPQHSHKPQSPALSCNQRHVIGNSIKITAPESPAKLQGWGGGITGGRGRGYSVRVLRKTRGGSCWLEAER